jgi:hypothetical protein
MSTASKAGFPIAAMILVAAVGIVMSALPNGIAWWTIGCPVWIADGDERFYLGIASQAYFNHPTYARDPVFATGGFTHYPQLPLLPGEMIAKVLHLGPLGINPVWRVWAGVSIALGWYLVVGHYVKRPWITAGLAILLLSDSGLRGGRLLVRQMLTFWDCLVNRDHGPRTISAWRIPTPSMTQVYLLLHLWLLARARDRPSWPRLALSGLGFGLLFYVYPYYWIAACPALLMAWVLDAGHRKVYSHTGWIGGLIGLPHVVNDWLLKRSTSPDWLSRADRFVPFPRFEELLLPKMSLFLIVAGLVWVWYRRKDLIYLWALPFSALVLTNHHLLTAIQIENFHWNVFVHEPIIGLFVLLVIAGELPVRGPWSRPVLWGLLVICSADLAMGVWLRAIETTRHHFFASFQRYKTQRLGEQQSVRLAPNSVIGGDSDFVAFAMIAENQRPLMDYAVFLSPSIDNAEWERRIALNGYLFGHDRPSFEAVQVSDLTPPPQAYQWGPWTRSPAERTRRIAMRMAFFDAITANPSEFFERYRVRYVALPPERVPPVVLNSEWRCLQEGPFWSIWERLPVVQPP